MLPLHGKCCKLFIAKDAKIWCELCEHAQKTKITSDDQIIYKSSTELYMHQLKLSLLYPLKTFVMIHGKRACVKTSTSKFRYRCTWILTSTSWNMPFSYGSSHLEYKEKQKIEKGLREILCTLCTKKQFLGSGNWELTFQNSELWILWKKFTM